MYVYKKSGRLLYTVGYYDPKGEWQPESDHEAAEDAAKRVNFLNGGAPPVENRVVEALRDTADQWDAMTEADRESLRTLGRIENSP